MIRQNHGFYFVQKIPYISEKNHKDKSYIF